MEEQIDQIDNLNRLLEAEKEHNKNETWNKLDNSSKLNKLHTYAEIYSTNNSSELKEYFSECIEKNKLKKVKDVEYDKVNGVILSIPGLIYNSSHKKFTIKNMEKRVSTIKSLTPKRSCGKNKSVSNTEASKSNEEKIEC
jgi:hypothetical protein